MNSIHNTVITGHGCMLGLCFVSVPSLCRPWPGQVSHCRCAFGTFQTKLETTGIDTTLAGQTNSRIHTSGNTTASVSPERTIEIGKRCRRVRSPDRGDYGLTTGSSAGIDFLRRVCSAQAAGLAFYAMRRGMVNGRCRHMHRISISLPNYYTIE
jgi:hypothetical protein